MVMIMAVMFKNNWKIYEKVDCRGSSLRPKKQQLAFQAQNLDLLSFSITCI